MNQFLWSDKHIVTNFIRRNSFSKSSVFKCNIKQYRLLTTMVLTNTNDLMIKTTIIIFAIRIAPDCKCWLPKCNRCTIIINHKCTLHDKRQHSKITTIRHQSKSKQYTMNENKCLVYVRVLQNEFYRQFLVLLNLLFTSNSVGLLN